MDRHRLILDCAKCVTAPHSVPVALELLELLPSANIPQPNAVVVLPGTPLQEAIMVQSGEKLTLLMSALCPSSVFRRLPVDRLKILTVLSPLPLPPCRGRVPVPPVPDVTRPQLVPPERPVTGGTQQISSSKRAVSHPFTPW